jgi:hypothetical protein
MTQGKNPVNGKMTVPVAQSQVLYAQFKNVRGVSASEGSRGVSVYKVKILDTLINQLSQAQKTPSVTSTDSLSGSQVDSLIFQYEAQIHQLTAGSVSGAASYMPVPEAPAAAVFAIAA